MQELHPFKVYISCSDAQHGALVGIELKKKLTEKGQRQAELDFVLCSLASYFPYMQFLTDLEHGGSVFFRPQVVAENGQFCPSHSLSCPLAHDACKAFEVWHCTQ